MKTISISGALVVCGVLLTGVVRADDTPQARRGQEAPPHKVAPTSSYKATTVLPPAIAKATSTTTATAPKTWQAVSTATAPTSAQNLLHPKPVQCTRTGSLIGPLSYSCPPGMMPMLGTSTVPGPPPCTCVLSNLNF